MDEAGWVSINPMRESNSTRQPGGNLGKDKTMHGASCKRGIRPRGSRGERREKGKGPEGVAFRRIM